MSLMKRVMALALSAMLLLAPVTSSAEEMLSSFRRLLPKCVTTAAVGMNIHKTGAHISAAGINALRILGNLHFVSFSDENNAIFLH